MRLIGEPVLPTLPEKMPVPPPLPQGVTLEALVDDKNPHPQRAAWIMEWEWRLDFNRRIDEAQERIERCSRDILEFGKEYFPDMFSQPFGGFHREMSDLVFNLNPDEWFYEDKYGNQLQKQGIALAAPRGHGKCLSGLTNVITYSGQYVPLRDINIGQEIVSLNQDTLHFERDAVVAKVFSGTKPVVCVRTRTGKELTLTREHRVFTYDGWKIAGELSLADRIASPRKVSIVPTVLGRQDAEIKLLAYILAEGGVTGTSTRFTNSDKEVVADFLISANEFGFNAGPVRGSYCYSLTKNSRSPQQWLRDNNLKGHSALTKRIPGWVFGLPERQKWLFLEALMITDGWFAKQAGQGGITLANEGLIDDINLLLMHLGIVATKSKKKENGFAGAWGLVFGRAGIRELLSHCDLKQKRASAEAAAATKTDASKYSLIDIYPDSIKSYRVHGTQWYRDNGLRIDNHYDLTRPKLRRMMTLEPGVHEWDRLEEADVFWDQIVSIEEAGECDTYDIQVAKNENFISNGLVTHNSAWMTFLLPLYCAVFRVKHFIVIFSNNRDGVTLFCTQIKREIEENEKLRADFGNLSGKAYGRPWGAFTFVICHPSDDDSSLPAYETMIAGRSVGTNVRGMRFGAYRPSLVLGDDLEKDENVQTSEQRGKMQGLLTQRIIPMLDPADGLIVVCGTLFHYDSLLARLLKPDSSQGWVQRVWKCILPPATDVLDKDAVPLWPERWPINKLRSQRLTPPMTLHEWNTEWMNDPSDPESREYKPEWFRWYSRSRHLRYNKKESTYEWCKPGDIHPLTGHARWQKLFIYQAVDPAPGLNKENDYFAMLTGGISALTHDVVIIHLVRGHFPFAEQVNVIEGQFMQFPMTVGCAIETENYQDVLRQTIINRQARRYGVRRVPVKGIKQKRLRDSKVGRLRRRAWDMQTGTVWFPAIQEGTAGYADAPYSEPTPAGERVRVHPLVYPLYREMIEFPKSRNDDTLDTFDMLLSVIGKRRIFNDQAAAEKDEILAADNPLVRPRARTPVVPGIAANGSAGVVQVDRRNNRRRTGRATPVLS